MDGRIGSGLPAGSGNAHGVVRLGTFHPAGGIRFGGACQRRSRSVLSCSRGLALRRWFMNRAYQVGYYIAVVVAVSYGVATIVFARRRELKPVVRVGFTTNPGAARWYGLAYVVPAVLQVRRLSCTQICCTMGPGAIYDRVLGSATA